MIVKEALKLIKRSLGEHGWFGREETDCIEQAIKQQETLQVEHEALKLKHAKTVELMGLYQTLYENNNENDYDLAPELVEEMEKRIEQLEKELRE